MNGSFRQAMSPVHTWAGLTLGWILYFMFVTGTASYFDTEIDRWMKPELPAFDIGIDGDQTEMLGLVERHLDKRVPETKHWYISFPQRRYPFLAVGWRDAHDETQVDVLDPDTGQQIVPRETGGGQALYEMHFELHYLPHEVAEWLVSASTMFMFVALITGVVIHKKLFREFFTFRPGRGQRSWLDLHNVFSVLTLPFLLMITYSGLLLFAYAAMPGIPAFASSYAAADEGAETARESRAESSWAPQRTAEPLSAMFEQVDRRWGKGEIAWIEVDEPGTDDPHVVIARQRDDRITEDERLLFDRVSGELRNPEAREPSASESFTSVLFGLHLGLFAGPVLRWVFFLSGVFGTAMVATGLVLWAVKRRGRAEQRTDGADRGLRLVERLNVGTLAGLPVGIAVYFWANRLVPPGLEGRADVEVNLMFAAWALTFAFSALRPLRRAWIELLSLAASLFALLPLLNVITTDRHLARSLPKGDWVFAGFDLSMLVLGLAFGAAALALARRAAVSDPPSRATATDGASAEASSGSSR